MENQLREILINEARQIAGYIFHLQLKCGGGEASQELDTASDAIYSFINALEKSEQ